jgi:hypothetical protein
VNRPAVATHISVATSAALVIILGGATLSSYYVYVLGLSVDLPLCVFGVFLLLLARPRVFLENRALGAALVVGLLLALWVVVPSQLGLQMNAKAFGGTVAGVFLWVLVRYVAVQVDDQRAAIFTVVRVVAIVHLVAFSIQFLAYYLGGVQIEFLSAFTGRDIRLETGSFSEERGRLFRATGLFNEPGTYSVHMLGLLWVLLSQRDYRMSVLAGLVAASIVLTFSAFGILAVGAILVALIFRSVVQAEIRRAAIVAVAAVLCVAPLAVTLYDYLAGRFLAEEPDVSYATRLEVLSYIASRDWLQLAVGDGFAEFPLDPTIAVNDASAAAWLVLTLGALGVAIAVALIWRQEAWMARLFAAILLASKLSPTHPFLFVVFALQESATKARRDASP